MATFDYIVIGAGSSGCVVANRLSADPRNAVLLIESGPPDRHPYLHVPRGYAKILGQNERLTWTFPARRFHGVNDVEYVFRGRTVGGTSAINGMVYMRGLSQDFDDWAMPNWSWAEIGAAYDAIENPEGRVPTAPLRIENHPYGIPLCDAVIDAIGENGVARMDDVNAADGEAIGYAARTIWRGWRQSAAKAFLPRSVRKRPNLTIVTDTDVDRLLFDGTRVTGVATISGGQRQDFNAAREVILSAGAIMSPKLLMRSGIGPASDLKALGIPVIAASPDVGGNMSDHRMVLQQFAVNAGSESREFSGWRLYRNALRQFLLGSGPLARPGFEVGGYVRTRPELTWPDVQMMMGPFRTERTGKKIEISKEHGACIGGYQTRPESRGRLRLTGADAAAPLDIDPNILDAEIDRQTVIATFRYVRELFGNPSLRPFDPVEIYPGPEVSSDDEVLDFFKRMSSSAFHLSGTCRMGLDEGSVVDERLRVRGVQGLRVVDISVMPRPTSGNTNAPAMAIGWQASNLILEDAER